MGYTSILFARARENGPLGNIFNNLLFDTNPNEVLANYPYSQILQTLLFLPPARNFEDQTIIYSQSDAEIRTQQLSEEVKSGGLIPIFTNVGVYGTVIVDYPAGVTGPNQGFLLAGSAWYLGNVILDVVVGLLSIISYRIETSEARERSKKAVPVYEYAQHL